MWMRAESSWQLDNLRPVEQSYCPSSCRSLMLPLKEKKVRELLLIISWVWVVQSLNVVPARKSGLGAGSAVLEEATVV